MKQYSVDSSVNPNPQPREPHFDDERTLQTARRVVPLEQINAKVRHRRHWVLGGAFAVAMMLGAASALLASYLKLRHATPSVATQISQEVEDAPASVAVANQAPTPEVQPSENNQDPDAALLETPKKEPSVKHRVIVARRASPPIDTDPDTTRLSEHDQLQRIRDSVLYDQWEERRARRVQRRERRRNEQLNHRDLSNLDEIFQGRRRP